MMNAVTYKQASPYPTEKVKAAIIAGKLIPVLFGLVAIFYPDAFERIPPGFELAVGGLITSLVIDVAAYFKQEKV